MKFKQLLTKSLLAAVCLLVGQSAWGYVVPSGYEIKNVFLGTNNGDGTVAAEDFSSVSVVSSAWSEDGLWLNSGDKLSIGTVEEVARPAVGSTVETGTVPTYVSGKCFQVHDRTKNACHYADYSFDAVSSGILVFSGDFWNSNKTYPQDIYFVDSEGKTVIRLLWSNGSGVRPFNYRYTASAEAEETTEGATGNLCTYRTYAGWGINEMTVDFSTGAVSLTIDYINRDDKREQTTVNFNIGTGRNIAKIKFGYGYWASTTADIYWYLDNLRLYTVDEMVQYNYTINAVAGETTIKEIATGKATPNSDFGAYIPEVIYYGGQYYRLDDNTISSYYASFSMGDEDVTKKIKYALAPNITAFWEGENLTAVGHAWYTNGNQSNNSECSDGAAVCPYSSSEAALNRGIGTSSTIAKGVYNITIKPYRWGDAGTSYAFRYSTDNETWTDVETVSFASNSNDAYIADHILIPGDSYLRLMSPNGATPRHAIDYILVEKATFSATIGEAGWATLYTPYALDFSGVEGLKAYTATTDGVRVTLTPVDNVPANTGVVLEGSAGNYSIPVIASSETAKGGLQGSATEATACPAETGFTYYILTLAQNGVDVQFNPATSGSIAAGKAFLKVAKTVGAKALSVMFANDPTGIATVNAAEVAQPAKRIVNGQLVIEKNGKRYNAAGAEF